MVPHIARLMSALEDREEKEVHLTLVDGDAVEPKNLVRQNFIERDLGKNKAEVLAARYSKAFRVDIKYYDAYIESPECLKRIFRNFYYGIDILIGCVDNNRTRKIMHEYFMTTKTNIVYIDSGNENHDGQVVMGVRDFFGRVVLPPVGTVYPDVLEEEEEEEPLSCADRAVQNPQDIMANVTAATIVMSFLNNIIALGKCDTHMVTFNCRNIIARPVYQDDETMSDKLL